MFILGFLPVKEDPLCVCCDFKHFSPEFEIVGVRVLVAFQRAQNLLLFFLARLVQSFPAVQRYLLVQLVDVEVISAPLKRIVLLFEVFDGVVVVLHFSRVAFLERRGDLVEYIAAFQHLEHVEELQDRLFHFLFGYPLVFFLRTIAVMRVVVVNDAFLYLRRDPETALAAYKPRTAISENVLVVLSALFFRTLFLRTIPHLARNERFVVCVSVQLLFVHKITAVKGIRQ